MSPDFTEGVKPMWDCYGLATKRLLLGDKGEQIKNSGMILRKQKG